MPEEANPQPNYCPICKKTYNLRKLPAPVCPNPKCEGQILVAKT